MPNCISGSFKQFCPVVLLITNEGQLEFGGFLRMPRARQYGFLRLDPRGDDYSDLYVPVEILQWFENDDEVEVRASLPACYYQHVITRKRYSRGVRMDLRLHPSTEGRT